MLSPLDRGTSNGQVLEDTLSSRITRRENKLKEARGFPTFCQTTFHSVLGEFNEMS